MYFKTLKAKTPLLCWHTMFCIPICSSAETIPTFEPHPSKDSISSLAKIQVSHWRIEWYLPSETSVSWGVVALDTENPPLSKMEASSSDNSESVIAIARAVVFTSTWETKPTPLQSLHSTIEEWLWADDVKSFTNESIIFFTLLLKTKEISGMLWVEWKKP